VEKRTSVVDHCSMLLFFGDAILVGALSTLAIESIFLTILVMAGRAE